MQKRTRQFFGIMVAALVAGHASAQDNAWRISKVSGEAWVSRSGADQASLTQEVELQAGDEIRTGRNGRVLLARGAETMLVSANSAISLPEQGRAGMTTVIQRAGTVLLDVEKRNVQHFEVETPFLAAVVKGTRFRVSIAQGQAKVDVVRGQVQVADFRSGQFAIVFPGQSGSASLNGAPGLHLGGQGRLGQITQGPSQASRVAPLLVPRSGLTAPVGARPIGSAAGTAPVGNPTPGAGTEQANASTKATVVKTAGGGARITAPIGEVKLDIGKLTNGMARSEATAVAGAPQRDTVWAVGTSASRSGASDTQNATRTSNSAVPPAPIVQSLASVQAQAKGRPAAADTASTGSARPNAIGQGSNTSKNSISGSSISGTASAVTSNAGIATAGNGNTGDGNGIGTSGNSISGTASAVTSNAGNANAGNGNSVDGNGNSGSNNSANGKGNGNSGNANNNGRATAPGLVNQLLGLIGNGLANSGAFGGPGGISVGNVGFGSGKGNGNGKH